ncbi:hypothetical protein N7512_001052 [Penicillium capsulatum]|nr:hypothetical protein N7512_001052 [Penicillium capsulatum]
MDTSQLPLSDLDLFCDWSGDPNDPIEVRMTIEVLCVPNTTVPIITTGFPVLKVEKSSIRPIEAKLDVNGKSQRSSNEPCSQSPQTPETKPTAFPRDFSPLLDFNDFSPLPTPGNVIVRDKTGGTGSADKPGLADLMRNPANVTPPSSRKRSAKAASLPDSVTDSERGYGSSKHKGKYSGDDSQSTIISLRHSIKPSLIPRPVSAFNNPTEPARVPLPTDSAPTSVADYGRFEELPLIHKEDVPKGNLKENQNPNTPLFTATVDDFDELLLQGTKTKSEQDLEKLSTVASPGTPYDRESSPDVSGFSLGVPADEVEAMSSSPPPVPLPLHPDHPRLIVVDKHYHVHTPRRCRSQPTHCLHYLSVVHAKGAAKGVVASDFPQPATTAAQ